ncbi:MAG: hypothetical protein IPN76_26240 [Saprospiraceae bacterium]|nr:hypothetical protein [Saprospiraceae bacterium]
MKNLAQLSIYLLCLLLQLSVTAQESPRIIWEHKYGYSLRSEAAHALIQNMAGGITLVGEWSPYGRKAGSDIYLVILDDRKKTLVEKQTFLGRQGDDGAFAMVQTLDGGYALAGYTESSKAPGYIGKRDAWLVKTNEHGEALWEKVVGTPHDDEFRGIAQDDQGNLYLTGKKQDELWLYKTDWLGQDLLDITFRDKPGKTQGSAIAVSPTGNIAIIGTRTTGQGTYQATIYTDNNGSVLWQKDFRQSTGQGILIDENGNVVTVGVFDDIKEREQVLVKK